jgi:hypothetical protein
MDNTSRSDPSIAVEARVARIGDLPAILRAERLYMQHMEPESEEGWTRAIDRNLQLWIDNLDRTVMLEHKGTVVGCEMWMKSGRVGTLITMNVSARQPPHQHRRGQRAQTPPRETSHPNRS